MHYNPLMLVYGLPLVAIWLIWVLASKVSSRRSLAVLEEAMAAGLAEPASLHPVIDPALCLGCAACVKACPEKSILGIIDGKAALIEPSHCIGHGACAAACPTDAISLVFGTETRGVDIPYVSPTFETNVRGLFIAGELGGMGLIKNAIEQGRQAVRFAANRTKSIQVPEGALDMLIVGAGPAGIAASLGALERGLNFATVEQESLGGTVAHYPRGKLVMTAPAELPLVGNVKFGEVFKEELLAFWQGVVRDHGLTINHDERVELLEQCDGLFHVRTTKREYQAATVILAIGRRGTPRRLDVPGEDRVKVVYRLIDPEQYRGQHVLVVGGGDSALEAAASIAEEDNTTVTLSYRSSAFGRARAKNRERVDATIATGRLTLLLESQVTQIDAASVNLMTRDGPQTIRNDIVIICAGGVLPSQFLRDAGVEVATKFGVA